MPYFADFDRDGHMDLAHAFQVLTRGQEYLATRLWWHGRHRSGGRMSSDVGAAIRGEGRRTGWRLGLGSSYRFWELRRSGIYDQQLRTWGAGAIRVVRASLKRRASLINGVEGSDRRELIDADVGGGPCFERPTRFREIRDVTSDPVFVIGREDRRARRRSGSCKGRADGLHGRVHRNASSEDRTAVGEFEVRQTGVQRHRTSVAATIAVRR